MGNATLINIGLAALLLVQGIERPVDRSNETNDFVAFIVGRVEDREGRPVAGATVSIGTMGRVPEILSDERGQFRYRIMRPGRYNVAASKQAEMYPPSDVTLYTTDSAGAVSVNVSAPGETDVGAVVLAPQGARLLCKLVDAETGKPFDGVMLELCRVDDPEACMKGSLSTDRKGVVSLLVPAAPVTLRLEEPGFEPCYVGAAGVSDKEVAVGPEAGTTKELVVQFTRKHNEATK